jgi:prepilin-type N-terminal cleavage/methylation domain-containing protein
MKQLNSVYLKDKSSDVRGFSLIELSIVLMIIGLLSAGIMVGQTMLRESQINSLMTDEQRYVAATATFQQKYNALPGDMYNATSYWGAMSTCPPNPGTTSPGGTITCNGDGNGQIVSVTSGMSNFVESLLFWKHLSNAQLVQGSYTGIPGSAGAWDHIFGVNSPAGRVSGLGIGVYYIGVMPTGIQNYFPGSYGHIMLIGAYYPDSLPYNPIFTTLEAQNFDQKFDDGLPGVGNVRTFKFGAQTGKYCATTNDPATAVYNTPAANANSQGVQCTLIMVTGF